MYGGDHITKAVTLGSQVKERQHPWVKLALRGRGGLFLQIQEAHTVEVTFLDLSTGRRCSHFHDLLLTALPVSHLVYH